MKYIVLLLLLSCSTTERENYICENYPILTGTDIDKDIEEGNAVFSRAIQVCRDRGSCLDKVVKIGPQNYHAYCNRGFRSDYRKSK